MREVAGKLVYDSLLELVRPNHTAVVVVDMQNDYCHSGGVTATSGRNTSLLNQIIPLQVRLLAAARKAGVRVIYLKNTVAPDLSTYGGGWQYSNVRKRPDGLDGPADCRYAVRLTRPSGTTLSRN